jgi:hypothetical protein
VSAAGDRREELEALLWKHAIPAPLVAEILAAADAYAKALRRQPRPKSPAATGKRHAVHYALAGGGRPACRPYDSFSARNWPVSGDLPAVTCGHCARIFARMEAEAS